MKNFKEIINDTMKSICADRDKCILENMTFENLLGLYQLVVEEISRRADESAKAKWKDAKTFKTGNIQIIKECK